jgi:hypothetical protein
VIVNRCCVIGPTEQIDHDVRVEQIAQSSTTGGLIGS